MRFFTNSVFLRMFFAVITLASPYAVAVNVEASSRLVDSNGVSLSVWNDGNGTLIVSGSNGQTKIEIPAFAAFAERIVRKSIVYDCTVILSGPLLGGVVAFNTGQLIDWVSGGPFVFSGMMVASGALAGATVASGFAAHFSPQKARRLKALQIVKRAWEYPGSLMLLDIPTSALIAGLEELKRFGDHLR